MKVEILDEYFKDSSKELGKVNFYAAQDDTDEGDFFVQSGMDCLNRFLTEQLNKKQADKSSFYIDFSSVLSTIEDNKLVDYLGINNCGDHFNIELVNSNYIKIYSFLEAKEKGIYYLPNFFINPIQPEALISTDKDLNNNIAFAIDASGDKSNTLNLIQRNNDKVYYAKTLLPLSYSEFRKKTAPSDPVDEEKLSECQIILHHNLKKFFLNQQSSQFTYLLSIPLIGSPSYRLHDMGNLNSHYSGQGAVFIFIVSPKNIEKGSLNDIALKASYLLKDITYNYLFDVGISLVKKSLKNAIKSAVAAIMSRNMSHNLGSHVLSYASTNLNHPFDMQVLSEYLQERMDFIAQITYQDRKSVV